MKNNLINDAVDGLAQLSSSTESLVVDSTQAHSIEVTNLEEMNHNSNKTMKMQMIIK